jgi:hypothetical protein
MAVPHGLHSDFEFAMWNLRGKIPAAVHEDDGLRRAMIVVAEWFRLRLL